MLTDKDIELWNERLAIHQSLLPLRLNHTPTGDVEFFRPVENPTLGGNFLSPYQITPPMVTDVTLLSEQEVKSITYKQEYQFLIKKDDWDLFQYVLDKRLSITFMLRTTLFNIDYDHKDKDLIKISHVIDENINNDIWSRYEVIIDNRLIDAMFILKMIMY